MGPYPFQGVAISDPSLPTTLEEGVRNRSWEFAQNEGALVKGQLTINISLI